MVFLASLVAAAAAAVFPPVAVDLPWQQKAHVYVQLTALQNDDILPSSHRYPPYLLL